jgi:2-phospho-L-lactate guanylyltransferase (CobY/MobA/RfbA family)
MPLTFGEPSFANHLAAARAAGLSPRVLELPGIGLDVDAPDDLAALLERGPHTRSARLLLGFPSGAPRACAN